MNHRSDADAEAMIGWAQLLHDIVERRLRPAGGADLVAPSWDAMFDHALAAVMHEMLASRLMQLEPAEFVATCRALGHDDAVLAELDRLVAERARVAERERGLLQLQRDAAVAGRLALARLDAGETLDVGLFDPARPDLAAWRHRDDAARRPLHRVLRVRLDDPAAGAARVVSDTWLGAVWAEPLRTAPVAPMTAVHLGTALPECAHLAPELTLHAPVRMVDTNGVVPSAPGMVGYVRTLDDQLLLDSPPDPRSDARQT